MVAQSQHAVFNCSYSCKTELSHTIFWFAGDQPGLQRTFWRGRTERFVQRSGLHVDVLNLSTCSDGTSDGLGIQQLRINASSAELYNRTAIQCLAIPKNSSYTSLYSSYSMLLISAIMDPDGELLLVCMNMMHVCYEVMYACALIGLYMLDTCSVTACYRKNFRTL